MSMIGIRVLAVSCAIGLAWPCALLTAQTAEMADTLVISLASARLLAAENNHDLEAASWRPEAVRGDLRAARALPNPDGTFEARTPGDGWASRFEAEVGMEFEVAGQRGLRGSAREASLRASLARYDDAARKTLEDVSYAHHRLVAAEQRVALVEAIDRLNTRLHSAVQIQLAEGEISVLEANLAAIEAARARARLAEVTSARTSASLTLGRLLGQDPGTPIRTTGPLGQDARRRTPSAPTPDLVEAAIEQRPDILALAHEAVRARQEERLAAREAWPNLRLAGLATREDPDDVTRFGISVGMSLPLFNRNQGLSDRRKAEAAEVDALRRGAVLRLHTEIEDAIRSLESVEQEVALLEAKMLVPIRQNQSLLDTAYQEGKIDLADLLLLRNQLLDAELSYWDAWERRERARTGLESAAGLITENISLASRYEQ